MVTESALEQRIRRGLPIVRVLQVVVPLSVSRWAEKRAATRVRVPADIAHKVVVANGVRCEWFIPQGSPPDRVLLYLHGGGFVFGISSLHRSMVTYLARLMKTRVLMVDYRLAPDDPFPAALDDCVAAYRWLLAQGVPAQNLVVAGDSAGGNLTMTTLMHVRDSGAPAPAAAACLSPVADFSEEGRFLGEFRDPILHPKAADFYGRSYVAQGDPRNALISPVYGDWHHLPPLLIHVGEDEVLRDDAERVAELARAAGVDVLLQVYPRMWHVWQLYPALPQAAQSLGEIADFFNSHLGANLEPAHEG